MFTGIVEETGKVLACRTARGGSTLEIEAKTVTGGVKTGDSVSVNGVCLTVTAVSKNRLSFNVVTETLGRSTLGALKPRDPVNLERSLSQGGSFGGHFVYGHIDGMFRVAAFKKTGGSAYIDVALDGPSMKYVVEKGSVALDGVSLTVGRLAGAGIRVYLIPHTVSTTALFAKKPGDYVNVEFDVIAKYVENFVSREKNAITEKFLKDRGF